MPKLVVTLIRGLLNSEECLRCKAASINFSIER